MGGTVWRFIIIGKYKKKETNIVIQQLRSFRFVFYGLCFDLISISYAKIGKGKISKLTIIGKSRVLG